MLVTGAAGLIGRATLDRLAARGVPANALVLDDPGDLQAELVVTGDARDPEVVRAALIDADAVIHLAAIPTPLNDPAPTVFAVNTQATFTVLEEAGRAGIRQVALASTICVTGLVFPTRPLQAPYVPIDVDMPSQAEDPYALSKQADELTAAMMARRHGMGVVALRLPFVGDVEGRLRGYKEQLATDPARHAGSMWAYLDARDAARAFELALRAGVPGTAAVVYVAAPTTQAALPTEELVRRYHPDAQQRAPLPGHTVPVDLTPARELLGFEAEYVY